PWTINKKEDMQRLVDWGVDGIITDYPDRAKSLGLGVKIPYQER
ncbi:MAG: glycerophosphodiester phosphodiesterase, partial [Saprospiraceae bacterium]|nr:glycerophosphodiester phosphodiesterase [Saprospiraceae bacterium]